MNPRFENLTKGFYTVVYPNGEHRTIAIKEIKDDFSGKTNTIIGFLNGPENTRSYRYFAFLNSGYVNFFKKFRASEDQVRLNRILACLGRINNNVDEAGKSYSLKSGNCYRCNRLLTTPESILNGIGPECARTNGEKRVKVAKYREMRAAA